MMILIGIYLLCILDRDDKKPRIKWVSGAESSVSRFVYECYIKPIFSRLAFFFVLGMCLSVLLSEVGLEAGHNSSVAVMSRGKRWLSHSLNIRWSRTS